MQRLPHICHTGEFIVKGLLLNGRKCWTGEYPSLCAHNRLIYRITRFLFGHNSIFHFLNCPLILVVTFFYMKNCYDFIITTITMLMHCFAHFFSRIDDCHSIESSLNSFVLALLRFVWKKWNQNVWTFSFISLESMEKVSIFGGSQHAQNTR